MQQLRVCLASSEHDHLERKVVAGVCVGILNKSWRGKTPGVAGIHPRERIDPSPFAINPTRVTMGTLHHHTAVGGWVGE